MSDDNVITLPDLRAAKGGKPLRRRTAQVIAVTSPVTIDLPPSICERLDIAATRMKCSRERAAESFIIYSLAQFEGKSMLEFTMSLLPAADLKIIPLTKRPEPQK